MNYLKNLGFTLIELMIVVAIIGVLAAITYPNYRQHVIKTHRTDGERSLLELSQYLERFYTENGRYDQDTGGTAVSLPFNVSPQDGGTTQYNISFATGEPTQTSFILKAVPTGGQTADTDCGTVTIDHAGVKCILDSTTKCSNNATYKDDVADCW